MGLIKPKTGGSGVTHELYTMEITNAGTFTLFTNHCNNSAKATSEEINAGETKSITFIRDSCIQVYAIDYETFTSPAITFSNNEGCEGVLQRDIDGIGYITNGPGKANSKITVS